VGKEKYRIPDLIRSIGSGGKIGTNSERERRKLPEIEHKKYKSYYKSQVRDLLRRGDVTCSITSRSDHVSSVKARLEGPGYFQHEVRCLRNYGKGLASPVTGKKGGVMPRISRHAV